MAYWKMQTYNEWGGKLTGHCSDDDRKFRLGILLSELRGAKADLDEAQRQFDAEIAACRRDGQESIADDFSARRPG